MLDKNYVKLGDQPSKVEFMDEEFASSPNKQYSPMYSVKVHEQQATCKKHGVLCRAMTRLHIKKKKKHDKERLFIDEETCESHDSLDECELGHGRKRNMHDWMQSKQISLSSPKSKSKSNKKNRDEDLLISGEELYDSDDEETMVYKGKQKEFYLLPNNKYDLLQEITVIEHESEKYDEKNEYVITIESKTKTTTSQYLKKQWKGKRAKKARKRIRTFVGRSWLYIKVGLGTNTNVMDIGGATANLITSLGKEDRR